MADIETVNFPGTPEADYRHGGLKADTLSGGAGDDALLGSQYGDEKDDLGDTLNGDQGNDSLYGHYGDDVLNGGADNDRLYGGFGTDRLFGGAGDDVLSGGLVENYSTAVNNPGRPTFSGSDFIDGGAGKDIVEINYDVIVRETGLPFNVSLVFTENFMPRLSNRLGQFNGEQVVNCEVLHYTGGNGVNTIVGGRGNDIISGGLGIDTLDGGAGDDTIIDRGGRFTHKGGTGKDSLQVACASTSAVTLNGDAGTLQSSDGTSRFTDFEALSVASQGTGNDRLDGLAKGVNRLSGGRGNDVINGGILGDDLRGGEGADVIHGGAGDDTLSGSFSEDDNDALDRVYGEAGDDTVFVSDIRHIVKGSAYDGGGGTDLLDLTLNGSARITAPTVSDLTVATIAGFETMTVTSPSAQDYTIKLTTAQFAQFKEVAAYRFLLTTDATFQFADNGKVSLAGKTLALDVLQLANGGQTLDMTGADFERAPEVVGGSGNDTVIAVKSGLASLTFAGGGGNDTLIAGATYASFQGGEGNDTLVGSASRSGFNGGNGSDTMSYANASKAVTASLATPSLGTGDAAGDAFVLVENLTGTAFADTLMGDRGSNILDGGAGGDSLSGAAGNDTYIVDSGADRVLEAKGGGSDKVLSSVSFGLARGQEVETLQLLASTGKAKLSLVGNEFGQTLVGNAEANVLDGGLGADLMRGGKGADTFVFATTLGAGNVDRIADFAPEDTIRLSKSLVSVLAPGPLKATAFKDIGKAKADADDHILYDGRTGDLFYDTDGSGKAAAVKFAVLDNKAALTHADILIG